MKTYRNLTLASLLIIYIHNLNAQSVPEKAVDISPLLIGEKSPDILLKTSRNAEVKLLNLLAEKPTILIFYRGGWCPYCNTHLAELQAIEKDILDLGYQIIAVSPDSPENMKASMDKHKLNYTLLSDSKMEAGQAFGIAFLAPESSKAKMSTSSGGNNPDLMPVPSVFVINTSGEIQFEYINPNYKQRITGKLLLNVLKALKE